MTRYLIWDFDGTLAYREGMWSSALLTALAEVEPNSRVRREQFQPFLQTGFPWHNPDQPHVELKTSEAWWNELTPIFEQAFMHGGGLKLEQAQRLAKRIQHIYPNPHYWKVYDDTLPTLQQLSNQGWQHLILSNHVPELEAILVALELRPYFEQLFNSAKTGYEKPHPHAFQMVLATIPQYSAIWMIGDSFQADITGATRVDIPSILVRKRHPQAMTQCDNLSQLLAVIS